MSNSSTLLDTIATNQSNKEVVANALFDAASPAMLFGRHASACSGLTWGYYGGQFGTNAIANGTVTLTASSTNYVQANSSGVVSANTSGFTSGYAQLYTIVTGTTTVTSYTDLRQSGSGNGGGSGTVTSIAGAGGIESATGAITTSGTLRETMLLAGGAVQTAAYAFVTGDRGSTLVMNSASAVSQALPTPTGTTLSTNFPTGWFVALENIGAGTMTMTVPSGTKLDNVTNGTLALAQNTGCSVFTDGTNYFTVRGAATGGGGGFTNPMTTAGDIIIGGSGGTATRLGIGSSGQVLEVVSGAPAWVTPTVAGTTAPVALTTYYPGVPTASANLLKALVPLAVTFPAGLSGSVAQCDVAPTAAVTCPILHNGTNVGSVNFAASATTGTMTFTSAVTTTPGDLMVVQAPSSPDATFAGPAISLLGSAPATASNTTFASLSDVGVTTPLDGQMAVYNGTLAKWVNTSAPDENGFIDGNFDFWDVSTSIAVSTSDVYTADMWVANAGTGGAATISQVVRTLGSEPSYLIRPSKYQLQWAQTTAATANPVIGEKLEGVGQYNGQTITVQASLQAVAAGTDVVGIRATQYFGTGGSPSANVVTTQTVAWAVTTTEKKFSDTIAIPSTSGKTLGTSGTDWLRIDLLLATGATYTLKFSQLQIDVSPAGFNATNVGTGGAPQTFRYRGMAPEKARVQRHCWVLPAIGSGGGFITGSATGTGSAYAFFLLPVQMRASGSGSFIGSAPTYSGASGGTYALTGNGTGAAYLDVNGASGLTTNSAGYFAGGSSGTALLLDARLTV